MGIDTGERLVKPPEMEMVTSGRIFRPSSAFKKKYLFIAIVSICLGYIILYITFASSMYLAGAISGAYATEFFRTTMLFLTQWYIIICGTLLVVGLLVVNAWINSIQYSLVGESGEAMPEVYVRSGIIDITEKHVPLRTITNVSSRAGPFDRIFGIGSVFIETAGASSVQLGGVLAPDIKIEGVRFYHELRDHIVREMRSLKGTYTTGTEISAKADGFDTVGITSIDEEVVYTLREILKVLRRMEDKLDNLR